MKVFITGPFSRIGSRVLQAARQRGLEILGDASIEAKRRIVDVTDEAALRSFFKQNRPEWVIHTAAATDVDGCEKDPEHAWKLNALSAAHVAQASLEAGARLIHISTDFVFDGKAGPYSEEDTPAPLSVYGTTKLEGEEFVRKIYPAALIARICVPYDWNPEARPNFLMWAMEKIKAGERVKAFADQWSTPSCVPYVAMALLDLASTGEAGTVHLADRDFMNRFQFVRAAAHAFGYPEYLVAPCLTSDVKQIARRPAMGGLKVKKAENLLGYPMLSVEEGLRTVVEEFSRA